MIYYPTIGEALPIENFIENYTFENCYLPFDDDLQFALHFTNGTETFSIEEKAAERKFIRKWNEIFSDDIKEMWDLPRETCQIIDNLLLKDPAGHKIGGYPYFIEYDPREENAPHTFLLLQIDIDNVEGEEICWRNLGGIANFFISFEDLDNCKFDNIFFHWEDNYQG